jgi:phenylalanyl-tRNA synthetase beta chain
MKGTVELILRGLGIKDNVFTRCVDIPYMHPGRTAYVRINRKTAGYFGEAHPLAAGAFSLPERALAGVIELEDAFKAASPERAYKPLPKYPPVPRDLALIVDSGVPAGDIIRAIAKQGGSILENAEVFDVYTGAQVPEGKKSVAFSLMFRSDERTLTDDEVAAKISKIIEAVGKEFGAALRS